MKKWLYGLIIVLIFASTTFAGWNDPRREDYKLARIYSQLSNFVITQTWIDEERYVIFLDYNKDGVADTALLFVFWCDQALFKVEAPAHEIKPMIDEYLKRRSI